MPRYLSNEQAGTTTGLTQPAQVAQGFRSRGTVQGGRLKRLRGTINLAAQGPGSSDDFLIGFLPAGATFAYGVLTTSVSLGTAQIQVGTTGTLGKYRAAAVFTAVDAPTLFGPAAQVGAADPALAADEPILVTPTVAALPASGTLVVDIYYSAPN